MLKEKNSQIHYSLYKRKLKESISTASHTYKEREGVILHLRTPTEDIYGEGLFSLNELDKSKQETLNYLQNTSKLHIPTPIKIALEYIFADMMPRGLQKNINLNAMIPIQEGPIREKISTLYEKGFRVFKLKIEEKSIDSILDELQNIQNSYSDIKIRLDSNQKFSLEKAYQIKDKLKKLPLEYWEDPFPSSDIESWLELKKLSIPTSLDEACTEETTVDLFLKKNVCDFFTLKPSIIGPLEKCPALIHKINLHKKNYNISSSLETELGLLSLMKFAMRYGKKNITHGLATSFIFSNPRFQDKANVDEAFLDREKSKIKKELKDIEWKKLK